jgi:hypothetical protein
MVIAMRKNKLNRIRIRIASPIIPVDREYPAHKTKAIIRTEITTTDKHDLNSL